MWRNKKKAAGRLFAKMKGAKNVIFFDTETTGLEDDAKIIQFSGRMYSYDWYTKGLKERYHLALLDVRFCQVLSVPVSSFQ